MPNTPAPPGQFLKDSVFQGILRRIDFHSKLLEKIKECLPETLARHCQYCVTREDGGLVVFTDSQGFASQLRFYAPSVLVKLNTNGKMAFNRVLVRNLMPTAPAAVERPIKPVSTQVIKLLTAVSQTEPYDELGKAFAKLAATLEHHVGEKPDRPVMNS